MDVMNGHLAFARQLLEQAAPPPAGGEADGRAAGGDLVPPPLTPAELEGLGQACFCMVLEA